MSHCYPLAPRRLQALVRRPPLPSTVLPISLGIEQDCVPAALKVADLVHVARKSRESSRRTGAGSRRKLVRRISDEILHGVASARKSPPVPLNVLEVAVRRCRKSQYLPLVPRRRH